MSGPIVVKILADRQRAATINSVQQQQRRKREGAERAERNHPPVPCAPCTAACATHRCNHFCTRIEHHPDDWTSHVCGGCASAMVGMVVGVRT